MHSISRACAVARLYAASSNRRYNCVAARGWRATLVGKSAHAVYVLPWHHFLVR